MEFVQSKFNPQEARLILMLAQYLVANHYRPEQITILTLYSGQLISIKQLIRKAFARLAAVIVSTVDNYQGEENDIVLLSLVRSNKNSSIGFLKVSNRVCVALSRARIGRNPNGRLLPLRECPVPPQRVPGSFQDPVWPAGQAEGAALDQGSQDAEGNRGSLRSPASQVLHPRQLCHGQE